MKTYKEQSKHGKTGKTLRGESGCKLKLPGDEAKKTIGF